MNLYQRFLGGSRQKGTRPRRSQVRLELFSLLAVLLIGALAIGATSASAEEDDAPDAQTTPAAIAISGDADEFLDGAEQGVVIQAVDATPVDPEFETCMREQGVELPGMMFHERTDTGGDTGPSVESAPLDEAFARAAEQCGHPVEVFTHEFSGDTPTASAAEVAAFHECLSAAGVDLPQDAPPSGEAAEGEMALHLVIGASDPEVQAAFEQCAPLLPDGVVEFAPADSD